ncbi:hypothetical protein TNCV_1596901 [Trichonephila clavipes]|nr:hypothetical protein TNCV_1596901 [Trichonephila clavipes]
MHPPTTDSNKGGNMPIIWHQARRLPGVHPEHSAAASVRGSRIPKRGITSRLTGASSLLPAIYSEEWAKENAKDIHRTSFSSLRDAAHGKHAAWEINVVSRKEKSKYLKKFKIKTNIIKILKEIEEKETKINAI